MIHFSGVYLFTIDYDTRTCGFLSLCGPTEVHFVRNSITIRKFARNLALDRKSDFDMVRITQPFLTAHARHLLQRSACAQAQLARYRITKPFNFVCFFISNRTEVTEMSLLPDDSSG